MVLCDGQTLNQRVTLLQVTLYRTSSHIILKDGEYSAILWAHGIKSHAQKDYLFLETVYFIHLHHAAADIGGAATSQCCPVYLCTATVWKLSVSEHHYQ